MLQDKLGMVVLIQLPSYPYPKTKKKLHAAVQLFFFCHIFFGGLPQIHIKIGMESNENLSQIDKVRKKPALDKILP